MSASVVSPSRNQCQTPYSKPRRKSAGALRILNQSSHFQGVISSIYLRVGAFDKSGMVHYYEIALV